MPGIIHVADTFAAFLDDLQTRRAPALYQLSKLRNGFEGWLKIELYLWLTERYQLQPQTDVGVEYKVWLDVPVRRLRCPRCAVAREQLDWLAPHSRITHRFQQHIEVLLTLLPIKHVALLSGLHWHTLKALDKARLARSVPEPDLDQVRFLVMDEFALFKGHRYATVVMDAERTQVLWVGEGRSREAIRPFFEWMGKHCR